MSELIYRDEAYKVLSDYYHHKTDAQHKALNEALDRVPSVEPDQTHNLMDFARYQVAWLESHNDIKLKPELEKLMVRWIYDTAECYIFEHPEPECRTGRWIRDPLVRAYKCSCCGCRYSWPFPSMKYCGGCGAKMEVEASE